MKRTKTVEAPDVMYTYPSSISRGLESLWRNSAVDLEQQAEAILRAVLASRGIDDEQEIERRCGMRPEPGGALTFFIDGKAAVRLGELRHRREERNIVFTREVRRFEAHEDPDR